MKAITYKTYGQSEVLTANNLDCPSPGDDDVLIKVKAISLNASDWEFLTGSPIYTRALGPFKPRIGILGSDVAGTIAAIGKNVSDFEVGDNVMVDLFEKWGGFAQYVCAPQNKLVAKPDDITFPQAACLLQSATVALQGLSAKRDIKSGDKILINGAGGGAGTFAIQLAKMYGAEVSAVDTTAKHPLMRELGADHTIDFKKQNFTKSGQPYDIILDFVARHSLFALKRTLNPGGKYIMVGGTLAEIFQVLTLGPLISKMSNKHMGLLMHNQNTTDIKYMIGLCQTGKVVPIIDACFPLSQTARAMQYLGEGFARGNVVIEP